MSSVNSSAPRTTRRALLISGFAAGTLLVAPRARAEAWHNMDVFGYVPDLAFNMTDANTGRRVTAADFHGKFAMLYFGYTHCPDVCPLTMQRVGEIFDNLGKDAARFRLLFVTVDPNRDTLPVLKDYVAKFGPNFVGLRGDANSIAWLARRYRLAYSVTPATKTQPYEVTHSSAIYVFDPKGASRLLLASLATTHPDIKGTTEDLQRLLRDYSTPSVLARLLAEF